MAIGRAPRRRGRRYGRRQGRPLSHPGTWPGGGGLRSRGSPSLGRGGTRGLLLSGKAQGWLEHGGRSLLSASEAKDLYTYIFRTSSIGLALMFEESKQRLLNGVSSMAREMKSPKISKHVPPFVHAVINPNRNRKEGSTPRSVYYTILVSTNASPPQKKKKDTVPPRLLLTPSSSLIDLRAPPSVRACHLRPVRDHAAEIQGLRPRRPRSVSAATARTSPVPYLFY